MELPSFQILIQTDNNRGGRKNQWWILLLNLRMFVGLAHCSTSTFVGFAATKWLIVLSDPFFPFVYSSTFSFFFGGTDINCSLLIDYSNSPDDRGAKTLPMGGRFNRYLLLTVRIWSSNFIVCCVTCCCTCIISFCANEQGDVMLLFSPNVDNAPIVTRFWTIESFFVLSLLLPLQPVLDQINYWCCRCNWRYMRNSLPMTANSFSCRNSHLLEQHTT
jgi:hypothetical protein